MTRIIGIGVDIIEIARVKEAVDRWGNAFLKHIFNPIEIQYAARHKFPYPHYAVRFAAKEAVFKALGNSKIGWKDLTVVNGKDGKPFCRINPKKSKHKVLLSLSHSRNYAVASALVTA